MGYLLSGGTYDSSLGGMKKLREEATEKWKNLGFLDGLSGHVKENIAQLYESQASYLIKDDIKSSGGTKNEEKDD